MSSYQSPWWHNFPVSSALPLNFIAHLVFVRNSPPLKTEVCIELNIAMRTGNCRRHVAVAGHELQTNGTSQPDVQDRGPATSKFPNPNIAKTRNAKSAANTTNTITDAQSIFVGSSSRVHIARTSRLNLDSGIQILPTLDVLISTVPIIHLCEPLRPLHLCVETPRNATP